MTELTPQHVEWIERQALALLDIHVAVNALTEDEDNQLRRWLYSLASVRAAALNKSPSIFKSIRYDDPHATKGMTPK